MATSLEHPSNTLTKWMLSTLIVCFVCALDVQADLSSTSGEGDDVLLDYCAPYNGKICKSFITTGQVWYSNVSMQTNVGD